jgi:hypothetical protein
MQETEEGRRIDADANESPLHRSTAEVGPSLDFDPDDLRPKPWTLPRSSSVLMSLGLVLLLLLLAFLPPLIGVNQFRRRITQSVSESLGRPVHMDSVTLSMLPMPGFTLENFVVTEDPAFGSEPIIQARSVHVTLRVWSLWRRRVEFSRISLSDPSVNLVHRADGHWNIESILLSAAKIDAAPTAQAAASDAPRFPYIEATGARINVKNGFDKLPLALTDADLALWLPEPSQWRLRLEGHPTRTDSAPTDTGTMRVSGTLGRAATIATVPLDLTGEWTEAPLGGASWVMLGRDAGFRGALTLRTNVRGTVGQNAIESHLDLIDLRRADFVPLHPLNIAVDCKAQASEVFHRLSDVHCGTPAVTLTSPATPGLVVTGQVPDIADAHSLTGDATALNIPVDGLLDVLRLTSARVAPDLTAGGAISGRIACCGEAGEARPTNLLQGLSGRIAIDGARLARGNGKPFVDAEVAGEVAGGMLSIAPVPVNLGATLPAQVEARINGDGYSLHLSGMLLQSRLNELVAALPQFGDGLLEALPKAPAPATAALDTPIRVDVTSSRTWGGGQTWTPAAKPGKPRKTSRRR